MSAIDRMSEQMFDAPIPITDYSIYAGKYGSVGVDRNNALFEEPLVDIADGDVAGNCYYYQSDGKNFPYGQRIEGCLPKNYVRISALERLVQVNRVLEPLGKEVFVWNSYRPIETQAVFWNFFETKVRKENPDFSQRAIHDVVIKYVSDPSHLDENNPATWPTHFTGAAIDLTLRDKATGALDDMGAQFDEMSEKAHSDYIERLVASGRCSKVRPPLLNRRLLHGAMRSADFENYPMEYWHFDWGNQMYIYNRGRANGRSPGKAWYGFSQLQRE